MEFPLEGAKWTRAALIVSVFFAVIISFQAVRIWLADHRVESGRLDLMERGAALEPGNADAWDRLGQMRQWDIMNADPTQAVADLEKAVKDDPLSAHNWMDLAAAYEDSGDIPKARSAFARARAVYPSSPEVAWLYGNFLLRREEYDEGYAQMRQAVRTDPGLLAIAITRTWRSNHDVQLLLDRVVVLVFHQHHGSLPEARHGFVCRVSLINAQAYLIWIGEQAAFQQRFIVGV